MVYLDTSVALAHLLAEDRCPPERLWSETLVSSRLIEYELWTRVHARQLSDSHADTVRQLIGCLAIIELSPVVLERATAPFPVPVRTLDALHLASLCLLRDQRQHVVLATYDERMRNVAKALEVPIYAL